MEDIKILSENTIKIDEIKEEPEDCIEENSSNSIVKQEPEDNAEQQSWNVAEEGEPCSMKKEVKEEDEEEELKPPVRVDIKEEPTEEEEWGHKVKQEPSFYEKDQMGHFTTSSLSSLQTVKQESNDYEKDQVGHFTTSSLSSLQSEGDKPRSLKREVKQEKKEELVCADDQQQQQQERVKIPLQISQRNPKKRKQNSSVQGAIVKKPTTQGTLQAIEESMKEVKESYEKLMQSFKKVEESFARQNELCHVRPRTFCRYCQYMGELNYVPNPNYTEIVIRF